jgi:hypothetical protein
MGSRPAWPESNEALPWEQALKAAERSRPPGWRRPPKGEVFRPATPEGRFNLKVWEAIRLHRGLGVPGREWLQDLEEFISTEARNGLIQRALSEYRLELEGQGRSLPAEMVEHWQTALRP